MKENKNIFTKIFGKMVFTHIVLIIGSFFMIMPLVWLLRSSFMEKQQIFVFPPAWIPDPFTLKGYPAVFEMVPFFGYFVNTLIILVPSVLGILISSCMAAYAFARLRHPHANLIFGALMTTMMIPYVVTLIPTFMIWVKMGLVDTFLPLIVPKFFAPIFFVFLLRQFFLSIPKELDEAAVIDGANPIQILWHVILPLSKPALITVAIFAGLGEWNDFLGPLIYLEGEEMYTLAIGLAQFTGFYRIEWDLLFAATVMVVIPVIILFFVAQKHFIEGIALTGMKG